MIPPFGVDPSSDEISCYSKIFPNLIAGEWKKTGNATGDYNCHAWGLLCSSDLGWIQPDRNTLQIFTITGFDELYGQQGFTIHENSQPNCKPEYRQRKVALYCLNGVPRHSAKEIADDDWWESKLGSGIRIIHKLGHLEGDEYGTICRCYSRNDDNANLSLKGETPDFYRKKNV